MREGGREMIEKGSRERIERNEKETKVEMTIEEEEDEHHHLPLLVVQLPQGTAVVFQRHEFPNRFCSKVLQQ